MASLDNQNNITSVERHGVHVKDHVGSQTNFPQKQ